MLVKRVAMRVSNVRYRIISASSYKNKIPTGMWVIITPPRCATFGYLGCPISSWKMWFSVLVVTQEWWLAACINAPVKPQPGWANRPKSSPFWRCRNARSMVSNWAEKTENGHVVFLSVTLLERAIWLAKTSFLRVCYPMNHTSVFVSILWSIWANIHYKYFRTYHMRLTNI